MAYIYICKKKRKMVSYALAKQNVITNEFLDVIQANDMIRDLKDKCAGYELDIVDGSF